MDCSWASPAMILEHITFILLKKVNMLNMFISCLLTHEEWSSKWVINILKFVLVGIASFGKTCRVKR